MRKQCTTCGFWIALTADGVSYESENASHVGPLHAHQNELSDDMQGRQLFDVEENRPLCVHDWSVPPPEEMLAIHLCLSIPGYEHYVRTLPEAFQ